MSSLFFELSKQQKLLQMMEERGFTLCQQNGQRTYGGPPPNWGSRPPPSRDCEVFIGRIPRMCFEDELIPLFLSVGELYEFRLMLDFSGTNRGYGYAHYATYEGAMNAIKVLNRYEIRPGHHIGVLKSKNNCRLLFGNISSDVTYETFSKFIRSATGQVVNVSLFTNFNQLRATDLNVSLEIEEAYLERMARNNCNSLFAIVEYGNHKAAAVARRILIPKYGHALAIDWAVPPRERRRSIRAQGAGSQLSQHLPIPMVNTGPTLAPIKQLTKARPVPTLLTHTSVFDNIPFMAKAYSNIVKYFKFLINVTLHRSAQKGEIPLHVYIEMEKKIVDRITNLENCGQAIQLILNYLSWYNEKKIKTIDDESEEILQEIKIYSDSIFHFIYYKISCRKTSNPELEDYYCNILPLQLNFLYHMAVILTGENRAKVCGRISHSLQWFNEIIRKIKSGDKNMKDFLMQISRLEFENDDIATDSEGLTLLENQTLDRNGLLSTSNSGLSLLCRNIDDQTKTQIPSVTSSYQPFMDDVPATSSVNLRRDIPPFMTNGALDGSNRTLENDGFIGLKNTAFEDKHLEPSILNENNSIFEKNTENELLTMEPSLINYVYHTPKKF